MSSSGVSSGRSIIWSDCDGSFLLLLTDPLITVRLPSALESVSAELLFGAKPPKMVSITSDIVTYTSNFSDFEAVNNANVGIGINETWQIWKEHFSELTVGNFPKEEEVEREKTFIADFNADSPQWKGELVEYLGYNTNCFGTNAGWSNNAGSITTKQTYDFGDKFDVNFKLYTNYANGDKNNTNEDFYVTVGKFKIAICDFQTRVELYYDNQKLDGEFVCSNANYVAEKEYKYDVHIEKGLISCVLSTMISAPSLP